MYLHLEQWFHCNDNKIEPIDEEEVVDCSDNSPYIFFYEKIDDRSSADF